MAETESAMKSQNPEYDKFNAMMSRLIAVPHSEIKAKLDAEKREKARKRKPKRTSAPEKDNQ
jgi:hypothetical protein